MARSASTFSLSGCGKNAVVQRSNSLDNAPRPRVPVFVRAPCCPESPNKLAPADPHPEVHAYVQQMCQASVQDRRPCQELLVPSEHRRAPGAPRRETLL